MAESLFVTDGRLEKIRHATANAPSLQAFTNIDTEGWPENKANESTGTVHVSVNIGHIVMSCLRKMG